MAGFLKTLFGDTSKREIKKLKPIVDSIESMSEKYRAMSDKELQAETPRLKARLKAGETLDDILPEAFAAIREACWRVLGQYPFNVQLIGGVVLHQGRIAEMKTGEGKTITATLPAYLNALEEKGVNIVTVNDYLAKYQGELMGKVYRFMGMSCGVLVHGLTQGERKAAYACDITYGTNNEIGFDYLRDNMAIYKEEQVQRGHAFAIVDEVDSILIDEARTPLIISGQGDKSTDLYRLANDFARTLKSIKVVEVDDKESQDDIEADYIIDEKRHTATITPRGVTKAEAYFKIENLMDPENSTLMHHINQAIKANGCMQKDIDYVIKDGEIIIVDEFTGRLMFGRRYSEGLHQAIEAKENVNVLRESKTLATITFQNYFRLYSKLSGMTGTALTEEDEFRHIYNLDVIEIPTNKPMIRADNPDMVFKTENGKFSAVIRKIKECHEKGQPVLVGTVSIEKSEHLSSLLKREGVPHQVLNAKHHEKEAAIVAQAGKPYTVTIATNMAGRGTDIMLGGNSEFMAKADLSKAGYDDEVINEAAGYNETSDPVILEARELFRQKLLEHKDTCEKDGELVKKAGGLCIIGTERHESRRIDNQLRGRSGRQGDPGESTFYLSLEDDLMRLFGSERIMGMMDTLGVEEDMPIEHKVLSGAIENAQKKVEGRNFQSRKNVLEYDNVMNYQRELIYKQRSDVLDGAELKPQIQSMIREYVSQAVTEITQGGAALTKEQALQVIKTFTGLFIFQGQVVISAEKLASMTVADLIDLMTTKALDYYEYKEKDIGSDIMRELERVVLLKTVDQLWMDHIDAMQELRKGIGLNAYAQVNPIDEYKRQGMDMFDEMIAQIRSRTAKLIFIAKIKGAEPQRERVAKETSAAGAGDGTIAKKPIQKGKKVGRNDPCPCGSGLKYKKCCGKNQ
ncbi:MAG: preprotein translocase subunit SecA [Clostridiaceae bacterium]|nr:preprotein translocase subunit SecA [Clostridiaceae bacterium]